MAQETFTTNDKNILTKALKDKKNLRFHKRIQCVLFRIDGLSYRKIAELTGLSPQTASNPSSALPRTRTSWTLNRQAWWELPLLHDS